MVNNPKVCKYFDLPIQHISNNILKKMNRYDTKEKISSLNERMVALISKDYMRIYKKESEGKSEKEKLYLRLMLVTDYICGMTDSFAKDLYQEVLFALHLLA